MQAINDLPELLNKLDEGLAVRRKSIPDGNKILGSFYYKLDDDMLAKFLSLDCGSREYVALQLDLHQTIAGKAHSIEQEGHETPEA